MFNSKSNRNGELAKSLAKNADGFSIIEEALVISTSDDETVLDYLDEDEQPHYLLYNKEKGVTIESKIASQGSRFLVPHGYLGLVLFTNKRILFLIGHDKKPMNFVVYYDSIENVEIIEGWHTKFVVSTSEDTYTFPINRSCPGYGELGRIEAYVLTQIEKCSVGIEDNMADLSAQIAKIQYLTEFREYLEYFDEDRFKEHVDGFFEYYNEGAELCARMETVNGLTNEHIIYLEAYGDRNDRYAEYVESYIKETPEFAEYLSSYSKHINSNQGTILEYRDYLWAQARVNESALTHLLSYNGGSDFQHYREQYWRSRYPKYIIELNDLNSVLEQYINHILAYEAESEEFAEYTEAFAPEKEIIDSVLDRNSITV